MIFTHLKFTTILHALIAGVLLPLGWACAEPVGKSAVGEQVVEEGPLRAPQAGSGAKASSPPGGELAFELALRNCEEAREIRRKAANLPQPHIFFISPRTIDPKAFQYYEAWRKKVTEYGNRNYPLEAKGKLYGSVLLYIEINSDGNLECAQIARSSGHKVLDDAVLRIVRMAAPYDRFPEALERKADIVATVRTFVFAKTDKKETE